MELPAMYLFYALSDDAYQGFISRASGGSTRKSASANLLVGFEILEPLRTFTASFMEQVQPLRSQIQRLLKQNSRLRQARGLLLPRLMSGDLGMKDNPKW